MVKAVIVEAKGKAPALKNAMYPEFNTKQAKHERNAKIQSNILENA